MGLGRSHEVPEGGEGGEGGGGGGTRGCRVRNTNNKGYCTESDKVQKITDEKGS